MLRTIAILVLAAVLVPGCARHRLFARSSAPSSSSSFSTGEPAPDNTFLQFAAMKARGVIDLSESATLHASPPVRDLARTIATDQRGALDRIVRTAEQRHVVLPSQPDTEHLAEGERLAKLDGPEFDREYLARMVADHELLASAYEDRTRTASARAVRSIASDHAPVLQTDLAAARRLAGQDLTDTR